MPPQEATVDGDARLHETCVPGSHCGRCSTGGAVGHRRAVVAAEGRLETVCADRCSRRLLDWITGPPSRATYPAPIWNHGDPACDNSAADDDAYIIRLTPRNANSTSRFVATIYDQSTAPGGVVRFADPGWGGRAGSTARLQFRQKIVQVTR